MKNSLKILDVVAILQDIPSKNLAKGQVGTIIEILATDVFEVEFCDKNGRTISMEAIEGMFLLLLQFEAMAA
jgi:hypothetical protein